MTASDLPARQCPGGQSASTVDFNQESSHWTGSVDHKGCGFNYRLSEEAFQKQITSILDKTENKQCVLPLCSFGHKYLKENRSTRVAVRLIWLIRPRSDNIALLCPFSKCIHAVTENVILAIEDYKTEVEVDIITHLVGSMLGWQIVVLSFTILQ